MLSFYAMVFGVAASLIVGSVVVARNVRDSKTTIYALLTIAAVTLSVANYLAVELTENQLLYVRLVMFSSTVAVYFIYLLVCQIVDNGVKLGLFTSKLFYTTVAISIIDWTDLLFPAVVPGKPPMPVVGPGAVLYFSFFLLIIMLALRKLYSNFNVIKPKQRQQRKLLIIGAAPVLFLAPVTSFILPNLFGINQFVALTPLYAFIFVSCVGYAIVRHGLFDVRLAAVRSVAYALSIVSLAAIYYTIAYFVSAALFSGEMTSAVSISPINILLALVLSFVFQPIKNFFDKITNDVFYRDRYNSDDFFARFNEVLSTTTDLRGLLQRSATEIAATLKASQAFFYVQYNHVHHVSSGTEHHSNIPVRDAHQLNEYVKQSGSEIIVTDLLPDDDPIHRMLISHKVAVLMPLMRKDVVVGYLALGEQLSSGYTSRDIKVLNTISDELVIAIQNALSVQEVKDVNIHLQQRIDAATKELRASNAQLRHLDTTKDEFLSMASHQLRTPLTSVKGYISMVLEGDAGKVSDMQKHLLSEAFVSSERMVHLIHDFLNVSRLQTGKFMLETRPIDLVKLVDAEVSSLVRTAEARNMKLKFTHSGDMPVLNIDENKIQQVVMNYIDNAIFYSHEQTTILVSLRRDGDMAELRVHDTGIGVPKHEQAQLFTKFYRASNARKQRPDGTGVGLYLAKKVVTAHGGEVLFESQEGKGSTFGFRLPISKLEVTSSAE
jgi:signal transduction histidine kinase